MEDVAGFVDRMLATAPGRRGWDRDGFGSVGFGTGSYGGGRSASDGPDYGDAFSRMFSTEVGSKSANIVGNESKTLAILGNLAADALAMGTDGGRFAATQPSMGYELSSATSAMIVNQPDDVQTPPVLLVLDPHLPPGTTPYRVDWQSQDIAYRPTGLGALERIVNSEQVPSPYHHIAATVLASGADALNDILWIVRPEILVARHPEMEFVGCPSPALELQRAAAGKPTEVSSVGIFCRDADGVTGFTACHHGTGPVGTVVTLGGIPTVVKHADAIQDIVFLPLPDGYAVPNFARGLKGPRHQTPPWQGEPVEFEGRTSGYQSTKVSSHSPDLLGPDPLSQNKVFTPPDKVNKGDSGSALIDNEDQVLGFAFRRSRYGEEIGFAEWIWAANAMAAVGLTPL